MEFKAGGGSEHEQERTRVFESHRISLVRAPAEQHERKTVCNGWTDRIEGGMGELHLASNLERGVSAGLRS